jgi:hypothetical protein
MELHPEVMDEPRDEEPLAGVECGPWRDPLVAESTAARAARPGIAMGALTCSVPTGAAGRGVGGEWAGDVWAGDVWAGDEPRVSHPVVRFPVWPSPSEGPHVAPDQRPVVLVIEDGAGRVPSWPRRPVPKASP